MSQLITTQHIFNQGLLDFLQASPTPFHATRSMGELLKQAGFSELQENEIWQLETNRSYFVTRNQSSIVAFHTGNGDLTQTGIQMSGAHTDSPCLKLKPQPETVKKGYAQLGVEVYGGALLNPWFDRDLSIAGRVNFRDKEGRLASTLVDFKKPVATIPSLAIHLDREANKNRTVNEQNHLPPVIFQLADNEKFDFRELLKKYLLKDEVEVSEVIDFELSLYDVQPPSLLGFNEDFIASARLDNLLSCYIGVQALMSNTADRPSLFVSNDHEEVGSASAAGAQGPFLEAVLERLCEQCCEEGRKSENFRRLLSQSSMVSIDNAHGVHPNFADKHDQQHGPLLNKGVVIKVNANQRYATNSETATAFRDLAGKLQEPCQVFVVRSDMGCGSTIGPIVASELGVSTVDVGVPTFGMHSIRELGGATDAFSLYKIMQSFYSGNM